MRGGRFVVFEDGVEHKARADANELVNFDRFFFADDLERHQKSQAEDVGDLEFDVVADQNANAPRLAATLEASREVDAVTEQGVRDAVLGANVADVGNATVDALANRESFASFVPNTSDGINDRFTERQQSAHAGFDFGVGDNRRSTPASES